MGNTQIFNVSASDTYNYHYALGGHWSYNAASTEAGVVLGDMNPKLSRSTKLYSDCKYQISVSISSVYSGLTGAKGRTNTA